MFTDICALQFLSHDVGRPLQISNTFHLSTHDSADPITFDVLADFLASSSMDNAISKYLDVLSSSAVLDAVVCRQPKDPQDPTGVPHEASRAIDQNGTRGAAGTLPGAMCRLLSGHADTASRRARGHVFMPPSLDAADITDQGLWDSGGDYYLAVQAFRDQIVEWLFTSGGGHAGGAANDFDLATYSVKARTVDAPNYYFRWASMTIPDKIHWLRSREPHL